MTPDEGKDQVSTASDLLKKKWSCIASKQIVCWEKVKSYDLQLKETHPVSQSNIFFSFNFLFLLSPLLLPFSDFSSALSVWWRST